MVLTTASPALRRRAGSAAAMALLGAGLACAGNACASMDVPMPDTAIDIALSATADGPTAPQLPAVAVSHAIDLPAMPTQVELAADIPVPPPVERVAAPPVNPVSPLAQAPASEEPVARAPAAKHRAAKDPLATAMTVATREPDAPVTDARGGMAKWKPVAQARLDKQRGGFDVGGLQVSFGIDRAVFVNGALAVATSINIPDVSRITAAQAQQLQATLGGVAAAVANANTAANGAVAAANAAAANAQGAAGTAGQSATATANGAAASAQGAAGTAQAAANAAAQGANATAQGAAGMASQAVATATGTVVTNGMTNIVQNGAGNTANVGAMANMPSTVIQNTLNNQSIQSLMTINASVNTLAAFRTQMANTALNSVIQRSASMR
ncbi:hypothetical protein AB4120_19290 [Cupriavidus sp. 2KB_3]|uniref:hypothetical protein n=1 Tax=Cupriavidus sp. 2KB_3 TaxID=3232980 RepID=UPI003F922A4E